MINPCIINVLILSQQFIYWNAF